jgi:RNA polymerase sigma-70 factor (ECF subfamily)
MNNKAKSQRKTLSIPADANLQQNERLGLVCNPKRSSHEPPSAPAAMAPAPNEQGQTLADQLLVAAAKAGDANAFFELSNRHSSKLLRAAYRITSNWHDAEDALQEALLSAFTHIQGFEGRSSFSSWLTRIIMNSAYMIMRKKRGHVEIPIEGTNDESETWQKWEPCDPAASPEGQCIQRETAELLHRAILRLPAPFRSAVHLQHTREYSTKQIAATLGISVPAAKSRLSRARSALRDSINMAMY